MKHYGLKIAEGSDITNITVPSGTSFPANDNVGEFYYRTDLDDLYIRNNTTWEVVGGSGDGSGNIITEYALDSFVGNGVQTVFVASQSIATDAGVLISFDGVVQHITEYSVSGTNITFSEAVPNLVEIEVLHIGATIVDLFDGDGATVDFTLSQLVSSNSMIIVTISGVSQHTTSYSLDGTTLTFSAAPASGTDNIQVMHLSVVSSGGDGAVGGGTDAVFYENDTNVTTDYTISTGKNAVSAGPITIDNGITVTVPVGSEWSIV